MNALISENRDLLHKRDKDGLNLAELAVKKDRWAVLRQILEVEPSVAWSSHIIMSELLKQSKEELVEAVTLDESCAFSFTDPGDLEKYADLIVDLAKDGSIEIIHFLLQAGSPKSVSGFVPGD